MQINESKIAFICFLLFFRIGTFQWVTDDSNKKICACVTLYLKCNNRISLLSSRSRQKRGSSRSRQKRGFDPAIGKTYNTDFLVWQGNAYARGFKERLIVIVGGGGKRSDFCTSATSWRRWTLERQPRHRRLQVAHPSIGSPVRC
jgi:hypothetical protein